MFLVHALGTKTHSFFFGWGGGGEGVIRVQILNTMAYMCKVEFTVHQVGMFMKIVFKPYLNGSYVL